MPRPPKRPDTLWDEPSMGLAAARFTMRGPWGNHTHPDLELNLVLAGGVTYQHGGRRSHLPAGRLVALWSALPHGVVAVDGPSDFALVTVPLATVLAWGVPPAALARLLAGELLHDPGPEAVDRHLMPRWVADLRRGGEDRRTAALEIEARLRRLWGAAPGAPAGEANAAHRLVDWLCAHYQEPVTLADAAAATALHPRQAQRCLRHAGTTLTAFVERLRLAHAARLLARGDRDVLGIALDAGFASRSRFYAAFRRAFGCTPSAYRAGRIRGTG
jgi:AraC-like DNA-binding protein